MIELGSSTISAAGFEDYRPSTLYRRNRMSVRANNSTSFTGMCLEKSPEDTILAPPICTNLVVLPAHLTIPCRIDTQIGHLGNSSLSNQMNRISLGAIVARIYGMYHHCGSTVVRKVNVNRCTMFAIFVWHIWIEIELADLDERLLAFYFSTSGVEMSSSPRSTSMTSLSV